MNPDEYRLVMENNERVLATQQVIISNQEKILVNQQAIIASQEAIRIHQANMEQMLSNAMTMRDVVRDFKARVSAA